MDSIGGVLGAKLETCLTGRLGRTSVIFLVIGAGVIGVSTAGELRGRYGNRGLAIEKESLPGRHASGRNSDVLHAGISYEASSLSRSLFLTATPG